jgi:hypothetical protein
MTVVVEGQMEIQFFTRDAAGALCKDGTPLVLNKVLALLYLFLMP